MRLHTNHGRRVKSRVRAQNLPGSDTLPGGDLTAAVIILFVILMIIGVIAPYALGGFAISQWMG